MVTLPGVGTGVSSSSKLPQPASSSSSIHLIDLPLPTRVPAGLGGPFEAPQLIVPINKAIPFNVVGNGFTAELSPTISTVFVFDVRPEHSGKLCNLVFFMPPHFPIPDTTPVHLRSPGGIAVARLDNTATIPLISANSVGSSTRVGSVPSIQPANQYTISSAPCEAGQKVAYQVDSVGGLTMDFFQMTSPALGLFMIPS
jgi:glucan endo-1,3-beta-D-glucosidase